MVTFIFLTGIFLIAINLSKRPNFVFLLWGLLYSFSVLGPSYGINVVLTVGPLNVYATDLVSLMFLSIIIQRWDMLMNKLRHYPLGKLFAIVFGLNIAVLLFELLFSGQSIQSLFNLSRGFIDIPLFFFYYISFGYDDSTLGEFHKYLTILSLTVAAFFWVMTVLILAGKSSAFDNDRAVSAYIAFFPCISTVLLFARYASRKATRSEIILLIFFLLTTIFMRHRSIWLGCLGGIVVVLMSYRAEVPKFLALGFISALVIFALAFSFPSVGAKIIDKFLASSEILTERESFNKSTGAFRMARWTSRIKNNFDYRVLLFGQGHGYKRTSFISFNGRKGDNSTSFHNQYLEQAFRIGSVSVVLLLLAMFYLFRFNHLYLSRDVAVAFNAAYMCTMIYGMAYNFQLLFYIILAINVSLGMSIGYLALSNRNENSRGGAHVQQVPANKKLVLDAWKHKHS